MRADYDFDQLWVIDEDKGIEQPLIIKILITVNCALFLVFFILLVEYLGIFY